jgi:hypothetical protein
MDNTELKWSDNKLEDVINYLREGYCVTLQTSKGNTCTMHHTFHKCNNEPFNEEESKVIYFVLTGHEEMVEPWSQAIIKAGYSECNCELIYFVGSNISTYQFWYGTI